MGGCANCGGCSGCGNLELNSGEIGMLRKLGQIPFLPAARRADSAEPVYLADAELSVEEYSLILQCLEKKGLISLDYNMPLKGADPAVYGDFPIRGSFALTARGQQVLELLEIHGAEG